MPATPVLDRLLGTWEYGDQDGREEKDRYTISKSDAGQLLFDERHVSGKTARGVLRPTGGWFVADLRSEDGTPIGEIRLRVEGVGSMLSNFKGLQESSWGLDTVALKCASSIGCKAPVWFSSPSQESAPSLVPCAAWCSGQADHPRQQPILGQTTPIRGKDPGSGCFGQEEFMARLACSRAPRERSPSPLQSSL